MLSNKWLTIVSVKVLGSLISEIVDNMSELILPFNLAYCSKTPDNLLVKISLLSNTNSSFFKNFIFAFVYSSEELTFSIIHLDLPSTKTLTVPSGSLSICNILPSVPTLKRSFCLGSSTDGFFWVSKTICLFSSITNSKAFMDFNLPTNKGAIIWGKITISLKGNIG